MRNLLQKICALALLAGALARPALATDATYSRDLEHGSLQYFTILDSSFSGMPSGSSAEIVLMGTWKPESITASTQVLVDKRVTAGNQRSIEVYTSTDGKLRADVSADGTGATEDEIFTAGALSNGVTYNWKVWLTSNTLHMSINDVEEPTVAHTGGIFDSTAPFTIGASSSGGSTADGKLQSVAVYSSVPADLSGLTNKLYTCLSAGQKTGLVSWYDGDQVSGDLIDNHSTNNLTDVLSVGSAAGLLSCTAGGASTTHASCIMQDS